MKIYTLTSAGRTVAKNATGNDGESKILSYLHETKVADEDQLGILGGRGAIYLLKKHNLIKQVNE